MTRLICFYDIFHTDLVPLDQTAKKVFYLGVFKGLIHRIRPEYQENRSQRLLHDSALHQSTLLTIFFLNKNHILPTSRIHVEDLNAVQKACTCFLKDIANDDLKHFFDMLSDHENRCIECSGGFWNWFYKKIVACLLWNAPRTS